MGTFHLLVPARDTTSKRLQMSGKRPPCALIEQQHNAVIAVAGALIMCKELPSDEIETQIREAEAPTLAKIASPALAGGRPLPKMPPSLPPAPLPHPRHARWLRHLSLRLATLRMCNLVLTVGQGYVQIRRGRGRGGNRLVISQHALQVHGNGLAHIPLGLFAGISHRDAARQIGRVGAIIRLALLDDDEIAVHGPIPFLSAEAWAGLPYWLVTISVLVLDN